MEAVMLSIRSEWCQKIASGEKTVEVRKTKPKLETPFKCYIYCTKPKQSFMHGGIVEYTDDLYRLPSGEIKFGYSGELMLCSGQYGKDNFLCGKVIGEFICSRITYLGNVATDTWDRLIGNVHEESKRLIVEQALLSEAELHKYAAGKMLYGWHISELKIYDKPMELSKFRMPCAECDKDNPRCGNCEYYYYESNESVGFYDECLCDGLKHMVRPPQSWCYVEGC